MNEIFSCEVCGSQDLISVLDLGLHPLCDDLVKIGDMRQCVEYPIEIMYCRICNTAHQRFQVPKKDLFGKDYHYRARMTGSVLKGMSDLVDSCIQKLGDLDGKTVLDIGCNDGSLLNFFAANGCKTIGVEPTGAAFDSSHETINSFFDEVCVDKILNSIGKPDLITFTNVFAHIEDLPGLLKNIKALIGPETVLVIENHYLGAVLDYGQFDSFYHEHPRTYSFNSFVYIANTLGLNLMDCQFVSRYGGNIRAFIGPGSSIDFLGVNESKFFDRFANMNISILNWKRETLKSIDSYCIKYGKLRAKAFPGRAAILIKLLGLTEKHISAIYEIKGSIKVGHYAPGTKIPILPEADLYKESDLSIPILNLAWHLPKEVRENLLKNGYVGEVIDIKNFEIDQK
jgi:SAM-dependent methyltransferase